MDVYGVHVSPDPDLVTYWLADGSTSAAGVSAGDTWQVMDALERGGGRTGSGSATATSPCA